MVKSIAKTLIPEPIETGQPLFSTIRQGTATNQLTKIIPKDGRNLSVDFITGSATIEAKDLTVFIEKYSGVKLQTSAYMLLDVLTISLTESGAKSTSVPLPLDIYMDLRGLKDKKSARAQIKNDLISLYEVSLAFKDDNDKNQDFYDMRILQGKGIIKNGIIVVQFSEPFLNLLKRYPVMSYPNQMLKFNLKYNPHSYFLLRKISEHKNMNIGKTNEDRIRVETLLEACPLLPTYDEVMNGDRDVYGRVIEPFFRDMGVLAETIEYDYLHPNNMPITDEERISIKYKEFKELIVKITWKQYPDQTKRLEAKQAKIEESKNNKTIKKRGRPRKNS